MWFLRSLNGRRYFYIDKYKYNIYVEYTNKCLSLNINIINVQKDEFLIFIYHYLYVYTVICIYIYINMYI